MDLPSWLHATVVYLGAAVLAVPLARLLGLGSIIGYLAAGVVIGPWGLKAVTDTATILQFAEFGVVLMLFLVGLELEPKRLWSLRRPIFGWGSVQLFGSTALVGAVALAAGLTPLLALVAGLALAQSSTAIALGTVAERNLMPTSGGRSILSVSLFQDIGGIAILTLLPMLAMRPAGTGGPWLGLAQGVGMVLAIVLGGRLLVRPALRWIARSGSPEIFTAASLLLVVSTAALMHAVGLSMALGAFLAGVLLAESEYRRQLETDLEPFKGLLLGLFFIAVGMSIDFAVVLTQPLLMAAVVTGFVLLKGLLLVAMARLMDMPLAERPVFVVMLAQGGEFGFVVLQTAGSAGLVAAGPSSFLLAAIALSMLVTPLLMLLVDRVIAPRLAARGSGPALDEIAEDQAAPILILGFGRYGQVVGRLINANGLSATVLDHDAEQVATVRRFGWPAFYGDATRLDLLRIAGAATARVIVVAIDDTAQSLAVVDLLREHFPQATLVARARNATHWYGLHERGVQHIERETFDAALLSGRTVLELMGWQPHTARQQALRFKRHTLELMQAMAPHQGNEKELIALAKQGRQQLEELWAQERAERETSRQRRNAGFSAQHDEGDD
ncbi:glutathione-regulated potassium-efflux system protein KefC [Rubrivivax rivuli]|uniref:Glutathione-regulated potassium-efflux system protein KefC n=1 Tax=Rubrivivax rivuli TaxID=1862385 RepID=A0A437RD13_9BURK|nr:glutathione-regulated potassium-efflux system protein KefC [Rubrivivax rivuli]RVU44634.1 glutathione-regulated potassium-efflux system protein KefC [Rubrivivax rivuli]